MKRTVKVCLAFAACLCMLLAMMPTIVHAEQGNTVALPVRVCEYTECEGGMDYVYLDQTVLSASFTADDPNAVLDTNTMGGFTGILMDYIGEYERTYTLEEGYSRFCKVNLTNNLSEEPIAGKLTVSIPAGCDASSARYSLYKMDDSSATPFTAVASYTENTVTIPYSSVNSLSDYILIEFVATEAVPYTVVEGINSTWTVDSADGLAVRANGALEKFQSVKVDGATVDASNYTATSGSTIVTFTKEYLLTLSQGTHSITIVFTDGEASTNVTIAAAPASQPGTVQTTEAPKTPSQKDNVPATGEADTAELWIVLSMCGLAGMVCVYGFRRKKNNA